MSTEPPASPAASQAVERLKQLRDDVQNLARFKRGEAAYSQGNRDEPDYQADADAITEVLAQLASAERASRIQPLHHPDCPYVPWEDSVDDPPEGIECSCPREEIAARWKARAMLLQAQLDTLRAALAEAQIRLGHIQATLTANSVADYGLEPEHEAYVAADKMRHAFIEVAGEDFIAQWLDSRKVQP